MRRINVFQRQFSDLGMNFTLTAGGIGLPRRAASATLA
jgi:hypothetical protein